MIVFPPQRQYLWASMLGFTLIGLGVAVLAGWLLLRPVLTSPLRDRSGADVADPRAIAEVARSLSVVIPARNEAGSLPPLLESLARQSIAPREIIVVDDQSTDATAEIASRLGARVIATPDRPEEWLGKPWASHVGARAASGEYLLFLDADVTLGEHGLEALLMRFVSRREADEEAGDPVISVQPFHRARRAYERMAIFFNIQIFAGAARRTSGMKLELEGSCCFGPCILCSRASYDAIGGHHAVRSCVLEDIELGNLFRNAGFLVYGFSGRGDIDFRMYPDGLRSMVDGFSKNLLLGVLRANPWFFFLDVFWVSGLVAAPALVAIAATGAMWVELVAAALLYLVLVLEVGLAARRLGSFGAPAVLLYPVPLALFLLVVARVAVLAVTRRPVYWKGRPVNPFAVRP